MNKDELQAAYDELKADHDTLTAEHETLQTTVKEQADLISVADTEIAGLNKKLTSGVKTLSLKGKKEKVLKLAIFQTLDDKGNGTSNSEKADLCIEAIKQILAA